MPGQLIDGKSVAAAVREQVRGRADAFAARHGRPPGLEVVLVGDDAASQVYVRNKERASGKVGIRSNVHHLPADTTAGRLGELLTRLDADPLVDGILLQMPLPGQLDPDAMLSQIRAGKDVDGLTNESVARLVCDQPGLRPCTPLGCMRLLAEAGCDPQGKHAVIVGRSKLVGKPLAHLLLQRNATVTVAHSRTKSLADVVQQGDIVVAAAGRAGLVRGAWIKPGAVVIDVGINRDAEGRLRGDVDFEAARERASWITPVPGGVGPMTIAMLLSNTVDAANARLGH
ncbi:MAG: bifunctional methylenetetrahydrofolate dehydrogenase/methenyltetrahydrofolate cyclohydrolase FolD [Proteobacteria bacterium]|nr:bifunctional methylenetetrahydrofolate dehydrogenase/methenyltetrahydrofolate cyclohydrolase FolD [Pseudomonadota bacterium]